VTAGAEWFFDKNPCPHREWQGRRWFNIQIKISIHFRRNVGFELQSEMVKSNFIEWINK
jgi:hypothetical protein